MSVIVGWTFMLTLVGLTPANAEPCQGLVNILGDPPLSTLSAVWAAVLGDKGERARCSSLITVVDKLKNRSQTGGRKLEKERPFNPAEARANLEAALRDPAVRGRIEGLSREVPDQATRLFYEATILDEEGYYGARDLRVRQLLGQPN